MDTLLRRVLPAGRDTGFGVDLEGPNARRRSSGDKGAAGGREEAGGARCATHFDPIPPGVGQRELQLLGGCLTADT